MERRLDVTGPRGASSTLMAWNGYQSLLFLLEYGYFYVENTIRTSTCVYVYNTSVASRESRVDGDVDAVERIEILSW